jgi:hypothetical protein
MKIPGFGSRLILGLALACAHHPPAPSQIGGREGEDRKGGAVGEAEHVPLAATPAELLVPGAIEKIQDALAARGHLDRSARRGHLDVPTAGSIRKFQSDQDLARTGIPDHETVRRLGLDPDALFRKARASSSGPKAP